MCRVPVLVLICAISNYQWEANGLPLCGPFLLEEMEELISGGWLPEGLNMTQWRI
jgi:hypothetical protein